MLPPGEKRLLVILTSLCAEGTPVLTLDMCRQWKARGISPVVATLAERPNDLAPEFHAAGIPVRRMNLSASRRGRFPKLALAVYRLCRELRPDAVLSMPLGWHAFMFLGARAAGVRSTAAHVGNYPPLHAGREFMKFRTLVRLGQPVTNALICCSSYIQQGIWEHFGVSAHRTRLIYNGVDVEPIALAAARSRASRGSGPFVVGMVATLEIHKDQPTLIRAAARLRDAGVPIEVWLVGEGTRREEYQRLIAELSLQQVVRLLGMRRDVPALLGQMDAFVFSAKPDEGLGVALIEAMAASVPIIATDVGACREVLQDGALGKLVPAGDVAAMADAIAAMTRHPADHTRQVQDARRRALEVFSISEMARQYALCLKLESA